eukprot:s1264_g10.t1
MPYAAATAFVTGRSSQIQMPRAQCSPRSSIRGLSRAVAPWSLRKLLPQCLMTNARVRMSQNEPTCASFWPECMCWSAFLNSLASFLLCRLQSSLKQKHQVRIADPVNLLVSAAMISARWKLWLLQKALQF